MPELRRGAGVKLLLENGAVAMDEADLLGLLRYDHSLPTGVVPGKAWRRRRGGEWWRGMYGRPYPPGHEYHGQVPIVWQRIVVRGLPARWPSSVRVARPPL